MDNAAYIRDTDPQKPVKEVRIPLQTRDTNEPRPIQANPDSTTPSVTGSRVCKPEVCRRARNRYTQAQGSESPWHRNKTFYLLGTIVLFVIWLVIYVVLSALKMV